MNVYYRTTDTYAKYKERISRSLAYAKFGWLNYDFDFGFTYNLMEFKLKRLLKCLENGHAVQEEEDLNALKEMIKVVRRLHRERYDEKYLRLHDKKWGKTETLSIPKVGEDGKIRHYEYKSWKNSTKNASEEVKAQERREFRECWEKAEVDRCNDVDRLAELIKKHGPRLWD